MTTKTTTFRNTSTEAPVNRLPALLTLLLPLLIAGCSGGGDSTPTASNNSGTTLNATSTQSTLAAVVTPISTSTNDAEEEADTGRMNAASSDLELIYEPSWSGEQRVGLRFSLNIPPGSVIKNAHIQFTSDEISTGESNLIINAENSANAAPFSDNNFDISSRAVTTTSVNWSPPEWLTPGENNIDQRTPDISAVIQEVIDLDGWQTNNHIAFIISGTGTRTSVSHDGSPDNAPQLHIEYETITAEPEPKSEPAPEPTPVTPTDHIPVAQNDNLITAENTAATLNVLVNDSGLEDGIISITLISAPTNGTVSVNQNGELTYTPASSYAGSDQFTYNITDTDGDSSSADVYVTVTAHDHQPVANADNITTTEGTPATTNILNNDNGLDDGNIVIVISSAPTNGSVSVGINGEITYTPNKGYSGTDSFQYRITDTDGDSSSASVTVTISAIDHFPVANDDSITTTSGTSVTFNALSNDTGLEDGGITITITSPPVNGSILMGQNGAVTYTPNSGHTGNDAFSYRITDADGDTSNANVTAITDPLSLTQPASDDAEETMSTGRMDLASSNLELSLHTDGTGGQRIGIRFKLNIPSNSVITNAYIQFTASQTWSGESNLFIFAEKNANATVFSSNGLNISQRLGSDLTINWMPPAWNVVNESDINQRTPNLSSLIQEIIALDNWQANNHIAFIFYGSGTRIAHSLDSSLLNYGTTIVAPQLHVEYTPADIASPAPTNAIPVAQFDSLITEKNTTASINVLNNDEGLEDTPITVTISTAPANGSVDVGTDGNLSYTPGNDYLGEDTFTYTITDANNDSDSASVNISIVDTNSIPQAVADSAITQTGTPVTIAILDNDTGLDNAPITVTISQAPSNGSVSIEPDNTITYTSNLEYFGADNFDYTITDIDNESASANVQITVSCSSGVCSKTIRSSWNANTESDIAGYYLYHGTQSGIYTDKIWVGNQTSYDFSTSELTDHFFAVSAVNTANDESALSAEASISLAP